MCMWKERLYLKKRGKREVLHFLTSNKKPHVDSYRRYFVLKFAVIFMVHEYNIRHPVKSELMKLSTWL